MSIKKILSLPFSGCISFYPNRPLDHLIEMQGEKCVS